MKKNLIIGFILGLAIIIGGSFFFFNKDVLKEPEVANVDEQPVVTQNEPTGESAETIIKNLLSQEQIALNPTITITKATDDHIKAEVFLNPGGGYLLAAKIDGQWKKVVEGNGIPQCEEVLGYDFPRDMIWNCMRNGELVELIEWAGAKSLVMDCEVKGVMQGHDKEVILEFEDGQKVHTVEPVIDDIMEVATLAQKECGKIIMATE